MATMLAFVLTDLDVPREAARRHLSTGVEHSFNRISIDGETSTSDTVLLLSSRRRPWPGDEAFAAVLHSVLSNLAEDVVRNGEGCSHVVRIAVTGAPDGEAAVTVARSIANAPLTKTAMRGNDPNVGRILQATGAACARLGLAPVPGDITLDIGGRRVFADGVFRLDGDEERWLAAYLRDRELPIPSPGWPRHEQRVEIAVNLGLGGAAAAVTGSDLSEEYVKINADYRT